MNIVYFAPCWMLSYNSCWKRLRWMESRVSQPLPTRTHQLYCRHRTITTRLVLIRLLYHFQPRTTPRSKLQRFHLDDSTQSELNIGSTTPTPTYHFHRHSSHLQTHSYHHRSTRVTQTRLGESIRGSTESTSQPG